MCKKRHATHHVVKDDTDLDNTVTDDFSSEEEYMYTHLISAGEDEAKSEWHEAVTVTVNGKKLQAQIDTGAAQSIMPLHIYKRLGCDQELGIMKEVHQAGKISTY